MLNINGVSNGFNGFQPNSLTLNQQSSSLGNTAALQKASELTSPRETEIPFYEYQKEPWRTDPTSEYGETFYVSIKKIDELLSLLSTQRTYEAFRADLFDAHPEMANKAFGFTLDRDASIKIIDRTNNLSDSEKANLTELINNYKSFKLDLQGHARTLMMLVDHDWQAFGGRHKLTIENFQTVIDFSTILKGDIGDMELEWISQIEAGAERLGGSSISEVV
ncbi:hypothetical protein AUC61_22345 [Pseudomonas sp. S25]|uniref:Uncharacterized protein n=1 Tax=Pseudomonas maioricensis TaxID=1766623 RepID=A0ABS9ZP81_9PSED|nr:hypothetical protein [Pseudomonas sp. S25]MCI8212277.1 hypothetical protein [Pseudomonas sp. S25]